MEANRTEQPLLRMAEDVGRTVVRGLEFFGLGASIASQALAWLLLVQLFAISLVLLAISFQLALQSCAVVAGTIGTVVQQADQHADAFEKPDG